MLVTQFKNKPASSIINFDELFDELFSSRSVSNAKNFTPAVNIHESEKGYHLEMAIPGFNKEEIQVKIDKNVLVISGEKKEEKSDETKKVKRKEFHYQSFNRSFSLHETIDVSKIEAKYENGILQVNLVKKEDEPAKAGIEIKVM